MDTLVVRVYNVRFGDAILVMIPERDGTKTITRHMLIDVGNVLSTSGGQDDVFEPVVQDILQVLDGAPLDLYVMTHEHLDHIQGLFYASERLSLKLPSVERAWLTSSSHPTYYETHTEARSSLAFAASSYQAARRYLHALGAERWPASVRALVDNNDGLAATGNPSRTKDCVAFLRELTPQTSFVHRAFDPTAAHSFSEATIEIWAPEEDTSSYYGRFDPGRLQPLALDVNEGEAVAHQEPLPPPGVDAGAFYSLVGSRARGYLDNLLAIDKAANNTSVVLCLEWRGWRLLFPGDAEERSWRTMDSFGLLKPVHFYKVGHHGSHNGTPSPELLDKILPVTPPDDRPRYAAISTCMDTYNNVPDPATQAELESRCDEVKTTLDLPDGGWLDFRFEG